MNRCDESRRGLLGLGVTGAAVLLVPGCGATQSDPGSGDSAVPDEAGDEASGDDGGDGGDGNDGACQPTCAAGTKTLEFPFTHYPQLQNVGGSAANNAPGYSDPSCQLDIIIVAQPTAGKYVAFSAACSHACCTVSYNKNRTELVCPCHGATFNTSGQVTGGPAPTALQKLTVCADACGVTVTYP